MSDKKVFDDYTEVNCNNCQQYWYDLCDGVPEDGSRPCTSYVATRNSDIPKKIEVLQKRVDRLENSLIVTNLIIVVYLAAQLFWG